MPAIIKKASRFAGRASSGVYGAGKRRRGTASGSQVRFCLMTAVVLLATCAASSPVATAQGFGLAKKTSVQLHRKMPATVHLPGPGFEIKATSHDPANADEARTLAELLTIELQKYDKRMQLKTPSPDEVINCSITAFQIPQPVGFVRNDVVLQKGHSLEEPRQYYKVTGSVSVSYQTKDGQARVLDSDNVTANYSQDFEAGTNQTTGGSIVTKVTNPFKRMAGKKTDESFGAPTPIELRRVLLGRVASQLASRLVNTDEILDVPLARGKLEQANDLAEKGLWTRYLETLETMTPLSSASDDAYRLYNIGVAYEALAYQSEDRNATEKFLEKAAISYGKAIDAKPSEKLFADPQNRIETAVAHYKKLQSGGAVTAKAEGVVTPPGGSAGSKAASVKATPKSIATTTTPVAAASKPSTSAASVVPGGAPKSAPNAGPALTNAQIIKMAKAGVDVDNIVATIHDASAVQFDVSPEGLVDLANNGVKGAIVSAMRDRMKRAAGRAVAK